MPLSSYYKQYDDINKAELERQKEVYKQLAETQKAQANQNADYAIKKIEDAADVQIKEAQSAYDGVIRTANVQRLIDERKVSERMANLGMTDSGVTRTQQTAIQLSRTNAINKAELARQKQVDALALEVNRQVGDINIQRQNTLTELDTQNQAYLLGLEEKYNANRNAWATGAYEADMDAEAKRYAAEQSAAASRYNAKLKAQSEQNSAKAKARANLISKLEDEDISISAKDAYVKDYIEQYGEDDIVASYLDNENYDFGYNGGNYEETGEETEDYDVNMVKNNPMVLSAVRNFGEPISTASKTTKQGIAIKIKEWSDAGYLSDAEVIYLLRLYSIPDNIFY